MKVEAVNDNISIKFDTYRGDDFYLAVHFVSQDKRAMPDLTVSLCLDKAIELRDELSRVIKSEIDRLNNSNPEQVAKEIADVIDWSYKEN